MLSEAGSSIEQSIYMEEICKQYNIDEEAFKAEMNQHYKKIVRPKVQLQEEKTPTHVQNVLNNEVLFLATLYHYPQIGKRAAEFIQPDMFEGQLLQDLAKAVFEALKSGVDIDMNYFTTKYPEATDQNIISHVVIFKDKRYEEISVLQKMVAENIKRLSSGYIEKRLKTTTDPNELQNLLFQKKELDKLYIDFING